MDSYVCSISQQPIRILARCTCDHPHDFELYYFLRWLRVNRTCPVTRSRSGLAFLTPGSQQHELARGLRDLNGTDFSNEFTDAEIDDLLQTIPLYSTASTASYNNVPPTIS